MGLLISLALSGLAGYIGGTFMGVTGPWYFNVLLGLVGGVVGNIVLGLIGIGSYSIIGDTIFSIIGACIVVFLYRKLKK